MKSSEGPRIERGQDRELLGSHRNRRAERIESNMGGLVEAFKKDEADGDQKNLEETVEKINEESKG